MAGLLARFIAGILERLRSPLAAETMGASDERCRITRLRRHGEAKGHHHHRDERHVGEERRGDPQQQACDEHEDEGSHIEASQGRAEHEGRWKHDSEEERRHPVSRG